MMPYNADWGRWCVAALLKSFKAAAGTTPFFVEGMVRQTEPLGNYFEFRVDGPYVREHANDHWQLYFEVNILVVTQMDLHSSIYDHEALKGLATTMFLDNIEVRKIGDKPVDDGSHVSFLRRRSRGQERIQVSEFGQIRPDVRIRQATVEGHYDIYID